MNKLEKEIKYRGYRGFIKLVGDEEKQWRQAYVLIPKENKLYGKNYKEIDLLSEECIGELVYSKSGKEAQLLTNEVEIPDDTWVLGIDFNQTLGGFDLDDVENELKWVIKDIKRKGK